MFSILIPSYNNLNYLDLCIKSINKNSKYNHQIIVHINEGKDGSLEYVKRNKLYYTFTEQNVGMPKALNKASKLAKYKYLIISHDDFYYCPGWDEEFKKEIELLNHNNFYLSGTMIGAKNITNVSYGNLPAEFDAGETFENFNENKLLKNLEKIKTYNYQGTTKHPALIHIDLWNKVGGWSEEFSPTGGDDTDFIMKLWLENIRIFKGLGRSLVYHFGSITTRKKNKALNTYLGSRGNKIFLKKWKITINFFETFYLQSGIDQDKKQVFRKYIGPLNYPKKNLKYLLNLLKCKFQLIYLIIVRFN